MAIWSKFIYGAIAVSVVAQLVDDGSKVTTDSKKAESPISKTSAVPHRPASRSIESVLSEGGAFELADPLSNKRSKLVVSNGWMTPPFGPAQQIVNLSLPTANCRGIQSVLGTHAICQNVTSQPVNGFSGDGRPVTLNVPKGGWYYMYEFDSTYSPGIYTIVGTSAL